MRVAILVLLGLLAMLQVKLWVGEGSIAEVRELERAIDAQIRDNTNLEARNRRLAAEIRDLKHGLDAIEERARRDLGMVREDETFYQIVDR